MDFNEQGVEVQEAFESLQKPPGQDDFQFSESQMTEQKNECKTGETEGNDPESVQVFKSFS